MLTLQQKQRSSWPHSLHQFLCFSPYFECSLLDFFSCLSEKQSGKQNHIFSALSNSLTPGLKRIPAVSFHNSYVWKPLLVFLRAGRGARFCLTWHPSLHAFKHSAQRAFPAPSLSQGPAPALRRQESPPAGTFRGRLACHAGMCAASPSPLVQAAHRHSHSGSEAGSGERPGLQSGARPCVPAHSPLGLGSYLPVTRSRGGSPAL